MATIHELLERGLQRVVEALVFAADSPVAARDVADVYSEVTGEDRPTESQVEEAVNRLNEVYEQSDRVFRIEAWGGGFRMATEKAVSPFLKSYFNREQDQRISRSLMETLSIVAYRQPVTKPEIDFVRGVDSGYAVNKLLEKGLVDVVGRSESLGRPLLYGTTRFFLEQFGLKSVDELPDLREIEEILDDPAFNKERAELLQLSREVERDTEADAANGEDDEPPRPASDEGLPGSASEEGQQTESSHTEKSTE